MFLKPAPGRTVYFEGSRIKLPEGGAEVPEPLSTHWHRRINDGDVVEAVEAGVAVPGHEHPQEG